MTLFIGKPSRSFRYGFWQVTVHFTFGFWQRKTKQPGFNRTRHWHLIGAFCGPDSAGASIPWIQRSRARTLGLLYPYPYITLPVLSVPLPSERDGYEVDISISQRNATQT